MFPSQGDKHLSFLEGQGFSRRILKIRNHVKELDSLSIGLDLSYDILITVTEGIEIIIMGNTPYVCPIRTE